jgi:hypothetical protein
MCLNGACAAISSSAARITVSGQGLAAKQHGAVGHDFAEALLILQR